MYYRKYSNNNVGILNVHDTSTSHNHDSWQRRSVQPPPKQQPHQHTVHQVQPNQVNSSQDRNNGDTTQKTGLGGEKSDSGGVLTIAAVENPNLTNV